MGYPDSDIKGTGGDRRNTDWGGQRESKTRDAGGKVPTIDGPGKHTTGYGGKKESKNRETGGNVPTMSDNDRGYSTKVSSVAGKSRRINDGVKRRK